MHIHRSVVPPEKKLEQVYRITEAQLRQIVFSASVVYANMLPQSTQAAEWARDECWREELAKIDAVEWV